MPSAKKVQVSLTEEQYELLRNLAKTRDASVSELIRQAIDRVYVSDLERDLSRRDAQRLGEISLLVSDEEEEIGIGGADVLAGREPGIDIDG